MEIETDLDVVLYDFLCKNGILIDKLKGNILLISENDCGIISPDAEVKKITFGLIPFLEKTDDLFDYIVYPDVDDSIDIEKLLIVADERLKSGGLAIMTEPANNINKYGRPVLEKHFARLHITFDWEILSFGRSSGLPLEQERHNTILLMRKP